MSGRLVGRVMRDGRQRSPGAQLVLMAIAEHAHDDGRGAFPAIDTMVTVTRLSRSSVIRHLGELERSGDLRVDRSRRVNHYAVVLHDQSQGDTRVTVTPVSGGHPLGVRVTPDQFQPDTQTSLTVTPEPSLSRNEPEANPPTVESPVDALRRIVAEAIEAGGEGLNPHALRVHVREVHGYPDLESLYELGTAKQLTTVGEEIERRMTR